MMIVCNSMHTFPRLWNSCSNKRPSSLFNPEFGSVGEYGLLEAARTVDTSDEARAVGVAEPVVAESERAGGGSKEPVEVGRLPLLRPGGWRRVALGVPIVSSSGMSSWSGRSSSFSE